MASRDKACFEIFNSLFNVNFTINYTQEGEFIGSFYHIKNFHFLHINVIPFAIKAKNISACLTAFQ